MDANFSWRFSATEEAMEPLEFWNYNQNLRIKNMKPNR